MNKIFFVSTGRAGTKWIANSLNVLYGKLVFSVHEPPRYIKGLAIGYHLNEVSLEDAARDFYILRSEILAKAQRREADYYVEANRNLAFLVDPIRKAFSKDTKIFGLIRDGRDYIVSMLNRGIWGPTDRTRYPRYYPKEDNSWYSKDQIYKITWSWVAMVSAFKDKVGTIYKIEDLINPNIDTLKGLLLETGLPEVEIPPKLIERRINYSRKYNHTGTFEDLPKKKQKLFWKMAGDLMKELGYLDLESPRIV